jgi:hypothetical protein
MDDTSFSCGAECGEIMHPAVAPDHRHWEPQLTRWDGPAEGETHATYHIWCRICHKFALHMRVWAEPGIPVTIERPPSVVHPECAAKEERPR